jgi:predicted enzyme related to lactoylglutathione lyase
MKPTFTPGSNIAMKVPAHEYEKTVAFYREVLGLQMIDGDAVSATPTTRFAFGDKVLWIDRVETLSQSETWLEVIADDLEAAASYLADHGIARRDEIEPLPAGFEGFWIASPCNAIHLVTNSI